MRRFLALWRRFLRRPVLLAVQNPLDGSGHHRKPRLRRPIEPRAVVEAVEHVAHDFELLQHHRNGLGLVDAGLRAVTRRILRQRVFQVLRDADVVHDQPRRFVAEHAVDARNRLHQPVPAHRFVHVHGVHARRIEAGQPHVAHDHQLQGVVRVAGAFGEQIAPRLVADVRLPFGRIGGSPGHHDLDGPGVVIPTVPIRAQLDDFVVELHANAPAHADDHPLAIERRHAVLEVLHDVLGDQLQALVRAHQCFDGGPLLLHALAGRLFFVLQNLLDLGVDLGLLILIQLDARQARFVIDRHRRAILHRTADVVDVDVVPKHRRGVDVVCLDGRAGKADERGIRQRIAQVLGKAIGDLAAFAIHFGLEAVLAAVRLIGDDHDVAARGERPIHLAKLLQRRENHPARSPVEQRLQVLAALGLHGRLPDQIPAHRERSEELVVQIVAVGQYHQRRVFEQRMPDELPGVKRHQQTLARPLGVPDHTHAPVAWLLILRRGQAIARRVFLRQIFRGQRAQGLLHRFFHRVELVVAGDDLDQPRAGLAEHGEIAHEIEQSALREHTLDQGREFRRALGGNIPAIGRAPGHETLQICRERTHPGRDAVRGDQQRVGVEQRRNLLLVGLQLVERTHQMRPRAARRFEFDHRQRQAVDEHHHIGPPVVRAVDHYELGNRQPVVLLRIFEVDQVHLAGRQRAISGDILDIHAFRHQPVQAAVLFEQ